MPKNFPSWNITTEVYTWYNMLPTMRSRMNIDYDTVTFPVMKYVFPSQCERLHFWVLHSASLRFNNYGRALSKLYTFTRESIYSVYVTRKIIF